ncbi:unnamed protein product [Ectocarpus sp. 4 AP-2014]
MAGAGAYWTFCCCCVCIGGGGGGARHAQREVVTIVACTVPIEVNMLIMSHRKVNITVIPNNGVKTIGKHAISASLSGLDDSIPHGQ